MKRAQLLGIDHYNAFSNQGGCANDAEALEPLLARNEDNTPNVACQTLTARDSVAAISPDALLEHVQTRLR